MIMVENGPSERAHYEGWGLPERSWKSDHQQESSAVAPNV